ncbi:MAG: serine/threonine-protein kinase [Myxococcota bacterium]
MSTENSLTDNLIHSRKYKLEKKIGEGGIGEVYLGYQQILDSRQKVAVKIVRFPDEDKAQLMRVRRESELLRSVHHPNIVNYIDYWESDNSCYLVMDFIEGKDLEELVEDSSFILSPRLLIKSMIQIIDALLYMKKYFKMHHRDIKPSNLILVENTSEESDSEEPEYHAMLIDFGNTKAVKSEDDDSESITQISGFMAGTPGYTAPTVSFDLFDERDDVFAVAATMMFCLLGENPFEVRGDMQDSMKKIMEQDYNLMHFSNTALGCWIRINLSISREERMNLDEARNSLMRILEKPLKETQIDHIRFIASDKQLLNLTEKVDEIKETRDASTIVDNLRDMGIFDQRKFLDVLNFSQSSESESKDLLNKEKNKIEGDSEFSMIEKALQKGEENDKNSQDDKQETSSLWVWGLILIIAIQAGFISFLLIRGRWMTKQHKLPQVAASKKKLIPTVASKNEPPEKQVIEKKKKKDSGGDTQAASKRTDEDLKKDLAEVDGMLEDSKKREKELQKLQLPVEYRKFIDNLRKFQNRKDIYNLLENPKERKQLFTNADRLFKLARKYDNKEAREQATIRYLAIWREAVKARLKVEGHRLVTYRLSQLLCAGGDSKKANFYKKFYKNKLKGKKIWNCKSEKDEESKKKSDQKKEDNTRIRKKKIEKVKKEKQ